MSDFPFDIVGFDLDGTLVNTSGDLGAAVNHALALAGRQPVPLDNIHEMVGGGAKMLLKQALERTGGMPADGFKPYYKALLAYYGEHVSVHSHPYEGCVEALEALAAMDVTLAVVTNKFESFARTLLGDLGLLGHFALLVGGDSLGKDADGQYRAKPMPDPLLHIRTECGGGPMAYIGDSSYDVDAAKAAGIPVLVAGWGYNDRPAGELGGDAVIRGFDELIPALKAL
ncbi:HAD hydrolase-like protein [Alteriqipengyuania flavescens]|uniref:HAD hydrolase-like protein n=1 Tax=Alteriqipengyuania flavescens TaxID=3053610 RepID=UPI0025B5BD01|nr:HAD hydrolase-like protein [Alteriqipengyuania flavescens]WJY18939.1 HAD hydrolase-like protein [Alteriqipengyuania flavescens]WJY24879.1 HAD hydrolase-like protein [Alteriqipengyuania flavescens]